MIRPYRSNYQKQPMQSLNRVLGSLKSYRLIVCGAFVSLLLLTAANAVTQS